MGGDRSARVAAGRVGGRRGCEVAGASAGPAPRYDHRADSLMMRRVGKVSGYYA